MHKKLCPDVSMDFNARSPELRLEEDEVVRTMNTARQYNVFKADGTKIGHVKIIFTLDDDGRKVVEVGEVRMQTERQGSGAELYKYLGEALQKEGYTLVSCAINSASRALWEKLVRTGLAKKNDKGEYELI